MVRIKPYICGLCTHIYLLGRQRKKHTRYIYIYIYVYNFYYMYIYIHMYTDTENEHQHTAKLILEPNFEDSTKTRRSILQLGPGLFGLLFTLGYNPNMYPNVFGPGGTKLIQCIKTPLWSAWGQTPCILYNQKTGCVHTTNNICCTSWPRPIIHLLYEINLRSWESLKRRKWTRICSCASYVASGHSDKPHWARADKDNISTSKR